LNGPLVVAVAMNGPSQGEAVERLASAITNTKGVAMATPPRVDPNRNPAVITVILTAPHSAATQALVRRLRSTVIPRTLGHSGVVAEVGGETAAGIDGADRLSDRLPLVVGVVIAVSFFVLCSMFRSLAIPLKAAVMNLLSIGAAYGVIVAVFQWGWLGHVLAIGRISPIDPWIPVVLFTVPFGLSMDSEVFLLSQIAERWRETGENSFAVADGLARTGREITAAATIMIFVFGSVVVEDPLHILKVFGLGLAVAILIDSTLVPMVLLPTVMELIGRRNWWLPRGLKRILPEVVAEPAPLHLGVQVDPADAVLSRRAGSRDGRGSRGLVHCAHDPGPGTRRRRAPGHEATQLRGDRGAGAGAGSGHVASRRDDRGRLGQAAGWGGFQLERGHSVQSPALPPGPAGQGRRAHCRRLPVRVRHHRSL